MAVIGTAEILVTANTTAFDQQLKSKVQASASRTRPKVDVDTSGAVSAIGRFDAAIDKADAKLKGFGLSLRDFSQFARAAGPALVAAAVGKFAVDAVQAAAALGEAQNLVTVTFRESADEVLRFAEAAPSALGTTETAALNAAGQVGQLAKSFGFTEQLAAKLGTTVVRIATDISSLRNVPVEQVQQAIESAFAGESEPLRRLGVDTRETRLQVLALKEGIIEEGEALDSTSRALAVMAAIQQDANDAFGDFANTSDSLPNLLRTLNAQLDQLKIQFGKALLPAVVDAVGGLSDFLTVVTAINDAVPTTGDAIGFLADKLPGLGDAASDLEKKMGGGFGLKDLLPGAIERRIIGLWADEIKRASGETEDLDASIEDLIESGKKLPLTFETLAQVPDKLADIRSEIDKITDARERLVDAISDGEQRVDDAEKRLIKTIEDNEERVDDAEKNLAKTRRDAARAAAEAQKDHAKTIEDAAERIADAQENLEDVRLEADKRRADAREALEEGRLDVKERVADAEERLEDARRQRLEAVLDATLGVEEAQAKGDLFAENRARRALTQAQRDRSVKEAAEDLLETQKEGARDITDLEEDLAEVRLQTREDIKQAEEDLADTIEEQNERVAESAQRLHDLEISLNERLLEAEERLAEAREDQAERVAEAQKDRLKAIEESTEKVEEAREKLAEAAGVTGDWAERLKVLNDQLERLNTLLAVSTSTGTLGDLILLNDIEGNAAGGSVRAGGWSVVGEEGPELVKWGSNATVVPFDQLMAGLQQLVGGGQSAGPGPITIVTGNTDARVLANELMFRLMQGVVS